MNIILASGSPRRRELLKMIVDEFEVMVSECEERITKSSPAEVTKELSMQKAEAVVCEIQAGKSDHLSDDFLVIGADTVVSVDGKILGKPADKENAREMICALQGRSHEVYTGVTLCCVQGTKCRNVSFAVDTKVYVAKMSEEEIEEYISTKEPYDKAGGYGIQGLFGKFVEKIDGDYNNVVGLPVQRLYREMKELLGL